jgi:hypothetical protein
MKKGDTMPSSTRWRAALNTSGGLTGLTTYAVLMPELRRLRRCRRCADARDLPEYQDTQ